MISNTPNKNLKLGEKVDFCKVNSINKMLYLLYYLLRLNTLKRTTDML